MTSHERPSSLAPPGDDLDDARIETLGLFLESHNRLVSQLNRELEEHANLSLQWLEMLLRLARTDGDCLKATELASEIALSSGGATRLVDRMESQGLVERRRNTTDRRVVHVCLTPTGRNRLTLALPVHIDGLERRLAAPLGTEMHTFAGLVRTLRDSNT